MTAMRIDTLDPSSRPLVESCTTLIVNAFADLDIVEFRGATLSKSVGGKDLSDQRIIR